MPLTANEQILDALVRHQTYLLRYSGYVRNRINTVLNSSEEALAEKIRGKLPPTGGFNSGSEEWKRLNRLKAQLATIRIGAWDEAKKFLEDEMVALAIQEPVFANNMFTNSLPVQLQTVMPTERMLKSIALSRPFEGRIMKEWAAKMESDDIARIGAALQQGMVQGETNDQIARRVVGTGSFQGTDGATQATRNQVAAVTRTAVMHVSNNAREQFFQDNADIITVERFVATLDSRTTLICAANDGKTFAIGKGPMPPLHYQCRSLRVPALDPGLMGERPARPHTQQQLLREFNEKQGIGKVTTREGLPYGMKGKFDAYAAQRKRELIGRVPASQSYNEWLQRQSVEFQEDTLGKTKSLLFRKGNLKLDKFTNRVGDELSLAQLARREAAAFKAAGLDPANY